MLPGTLASASAPVAQPKVEDNPFKLPDIMPPDAAGD
jgi:hypothetical protein